MSLRNYVWPISASVLFHGAILLFVLVGWESESVPKPSVQLRFVEAKLVELKPKAKPAAQPKQVQKVDLTKQRREQELAKQRAAEKRAQEKRAQEKKAQEAKLKREQEEQRKLEQQRQREAQEKLERQQRQQAELEKALEAERGMIMEEAYADEATAYMDAIARRIEQNWSRPSSARNNMEALLSIQLVPTGRVVSVSVIKSSGDVAFDRSAEQAVRQVEAFPEVKDMPPEVFERYYRRFNLLFKPQDLRQ